MLFKVSSVHDRQMRLLLGVYITVFYMLLLLLITWRLTYISIILFQITYFLVAPMFGDLAVVNVCGQKNDLNDVCISFVFCLLVTETCNYCTSFVMSKRSICMVRIICCALSELVSKYTFKV